MKENNKCTCTNVLQGKACEKECFPKDLIGGYISVDDRMSEGDNDVLYINHKGVVSIISTKNGSDFFITEIGTLTLNK
jgi:hypothetical protein